MNSANTPKPIELLAPARNAETAMEAIIHGADAVYMGAPMLGARKEAANSTDDIKSVVDFAHRYNARVYVTLNTIIYDNELKQAEQLIKDLYAIGVDALIVQDMGILKMDIPPIALHASTQCDTRTPEKARFLEQCGFSQIVLARELNLEEIKAIRQATTVPLEGFVHGALCVSFSGDCQASQVITGRSANRGECAQVCRFPFDLEDAYGKKILKNRHLLSLRDMNRISMIEPMLNAGISSLKIEGRLKDTAYVKNVVAAYRRALDVVIAESGGRYVRSSIGSTKLSFNPVLEKSFNRGFTPYFLDRKPLKGELANFLTPKWVGQEVATVVRNERKGIVVRLRAELHNGDGLGYFDRDGSFTGFRLNRVEGTTIFPAGNLRLTPGTVLYRNSDKERNEMMERRTAERKIGLDITLRITGTNTVVLELRDETGLEISVAENADLSPARTPQTEARRRTLEKLGETVYSLNSLHDVAGDIFIPASLLTYLRRKATETLDLTRAATYRFDRRRKPSDHPRLPEGKKLTRHDNIANRLAKEFYMEAGARQTPEAIEVTGTGGRETRVMETRYCLRRELGACLKTPAGNSLPTELYLTSGSNRFRLEFDCRRCLMHLIHIPGKNK